MRPFRFADQFILQMEIYATVTTTSMGLCEVSHSEPTRIDLSYNTNQIEHEIPTNEFNPNINHKFTISF